MSISKKTVLLFCPHNIDACKDVWQLLHVEKSGIGFNFNAEALSNKGIDRYFGDMPTIVGISINQFSNSALQSEMQNIRKKMSVLNDEIQKNKVITEAYDRYVIDNLKQLFIYAPYFKSYHQVPIVAVKGKFKNEPIAFSKFTPKLSFVVEQNDMGVFYIATYISINEHITPLLEFARRKYLLNFKQEYFLLSYKDYRTLEWLDKQDWESVGIEIEVFAEEVVKRLEADYNVDRNDLIHRTIIDVEPECVVLMSELSNAYVMLTPQFVYDSFTIDGNYKAEEIRTRDGVEYEIIRKEKAEKSFIERLIALHPEFKQQPNGYFYLLFAAAQKRHWFLKTYQLLLAENVQILGMDKLKHFKYSKEKIETNFEFLSEINNIISMRFAVQFGKEQVSLAELQKMLRNQQNAVVLKDSSIGVFDDEWMAQYGVMVKHAQIEKDVLKVPKWLAILSEAKPNQKENLPIQIGAEWWDKWRTWQDINATLYPVPNTVNATLRPYQAKGYEWMQLLQEIGAGACLADDMGLGKTLQTICFIAKQLEKSATGKILIVAPASLLYNWQNELQKFAPSITKSIYHGASRNKAVFADATNSVLITSYGTVRADVDFLRDVNFDTIILDESHSIKTPGAQITKAVHSLSSGSKILLSGTPIMNNTFDLYSQLHFALPSMFGSAEFFKKEYAEPIDVHKDSAKIRLLQRLTAPFILRRTKEQVATDLPPKTEITLWCEMEKDQRQVYEDIKARVAGEITGLIKTEGLNKSKLAVLQGIMKLRQVCNTPALLPDAEYKTIADSAKQDVLIDELVNNLSNHKALVFSQFTSMLDIIAKTLRQKGIPFLMLTGETPPKMRGQMVDEFNAADSKYKVFLLSLKAGNAGLNLTSADYVFLFDPWWNTAVEQQAIDRTHRIGQTKNVFAYKMICRDTIEEKIIKLQERKQKLSDELISEEDGFVKALSEDDIAFLFE